MGASHIFGGRQQGRVPGGASAYEIPTHTTKASGGSINDEERSIRGGEKNSRALQAFQRWEGSSYEARRGPSLLARNQANGCAAAAGRQPLCSGCERVAKAAVTTTKSLNGAASLAAASSTVGSLRMTGFLRKLSLKIG
ncbi:hypothetical protein MRX96_022957 [Rhipicephalus microplus]